MASEIWAYLGDSDSRRIAREAEQQATIRRGGVRHALRACHAESSPDILLVDLDGEANPLAHMSALMRVCRPQTAIMAAGSEDSVSLANELYRGGVFLYLAKPLDSEGLRRAIEEVEEAQVGEERPEIRSSRVALVLGKGMGVNTVTTLFARLAAERGRYVTCVDLDPDFGTLALALDTAPQRGFAQAIADAATGNADVERLQAQVDPRISLIAHPPDQAGQLHEERGLPRLFESLAPIAHLVLACGATVGQVEALRHLTTHHILVFEPTPAGVSVAGRWLAVLKGAPTTLVVNHPRPLPRLVHEAEIRTHLGDRSPDVWLPHLRGMAEAMALGEPQQALPNLEREELSRILNPLAGAGVVE